MSKTIRVTGRPLGLDDYKGLRLKVRCPYCHGEHTHSLRPDEVEGFRSPDCAKAGTRYLVYRPTAAELGRMLRELTDNGERMPGPTTKRGRAVAHIVLELARLEVRG